MELAGLINGNLRTAEGRATASAGNQIFLSGKTICAVGGWEEEVFFSVIDINIYFLQCWVLGAIKALQGLFPAGRI